MRRLFTLVELLVVIAIISILSALLLPTLGSAINSAKEVNCINNFKQIGAAVIFYTDDYNGTFMKSADWAVSPPYLWCGDRIMRDPTNIRYSRNCITPYLESIDVRRHCPAVANPIIGTPTDFSTYGTYAMSPWLVSKKISKVTLATQTFFAMDFYGYDHMRYRWGGFNDLTAFTAVQLDLWFRHNTTANILYVDGHVENGFTPDQLAKRWSEIQRPFFFGY